MRRRRSDDMSPWIGRKNEMSEMNDGAVWKRREEGGASERTKRR